MKIASIQLDIAWEDKQQNLAKVASLVKAAKTDGCDLVVLPEMFHTGFSMKTLAEAENGETVSKLAALAKQYDMNLIAGVALQAREKAKNIALVLDRTGTVISSYTKNHPFSFAKEGDYFVAGKDQVVFEIDGVKASVFICYDLRFPELFRKVARQVQVIFVIANWPESRQAHWEALLKARAIENQCFMVGVNRIGTDGNGLSYVGGSMVIDPLGNQVSYGQADQEVVFTDISIEQVADIRKKFPFLKDMKFD